MSDYGDQPTRGWPAQPPAQGRPIQRPASPAGQGGFGQQGYGSPPPRRRRRGRKRIGFGVTLVVLLVILFAGDQVAKAYAQNTIADKIASSGLNTKPSVTIQGWPFLTQIASRDVKEIDISSNNVLAGAAKVPFSFSAKAVGVHLNSSFNGATIDQISGSATVTYASVATLIPIPGLTITTKGPSTVNLSTALGGATGTIEQTGSNQITLRVGDLSGLASIASSILGGGSLAQSYTINIPRLPAGLVIRSVTATPTGIVATASATNTTLSQ